jgi:toxin ParE2
VKPFKLLPVAEQELQDSAGFYDQESPLLTDRFLDAFLAVMERLGRYPESGTRISGHLRIARLNEFPYNVVYRIESRSIIVVAMAHQSRKPNYWKGRI